MAEQQFVFRFQLVNLRQWSVLYFLNLKFLYTRAEVPQAHVPKMAPSIH